MITIAYCRQTFVCKCVGVYVCEYECMDMCIYVCIIIKTCDKISSTNTSGKQLQMTSGYITINKTEQKQKNIHCGGRGAWAKMTALKSPK